MNSRHTGSTQQTPGRGRTIRGPWAALCAAAAVVLGPAAVTATALGGQANAAPLHQALRTGPTPAYVPSDTVAGGTESRDLTVTRRA